MLLASDLRMQKGNMIFSLQKRSYGNLIKKETWEKKELFGLCPYVTAQKLLSGKWAILILHELANGPRRFNELQKEIDITQATLSTQLKQLEGEGLVHREIFPQVPPKVEYSLTDIGKAFQPVLDAIEQWGKKYIVYLGQKHSTKVKSM